MQSKYLKIFLKYLYNYTKNFTNIIFLNFLKFKKNLKILNFFSNAKSFTKVSFEIQ